MIRELFTLKRKPKAEVVPSDSRIFCGACKYFRNKDNYLGAGLSRCHHPSNVVRTEIVSPEGTGEHVGWRHTFDELNKNNDCQLSEGR